MPTTDELNEELKEEFDEFFKIQNEKLEETEFYKEIVKKEKE